MFSSNKLYSEGDYIRPIIQVALDLVETDRAVQIAKEAIEGGVDWIEVGTPLIKSEGMDAVRTLKKTFPQKIILADMKVADTGAIEVEMASKAGADVVMVLAGADDSTIIESVKAAKKYGVKIMADLISVADPSSRAKELEKMGVDYINVHSGIDQQMVGRDPLDIISEIVKVVSTPIAAAGGLDAAGCARAVQAGASIVIVGGNIIRSADVYASARKIRQSVDSPSVVQVPKLSQDSEIRKLLMEVSTPNISDAMHRKGVMKDIRPMLKGKKMVGTAVTVQTFGGDWAKPVEAIDMAKEGDVIVIYNGRRDIAPWGGLATLSCLNKGIAGVVIDGAIRDIDDISTMSLPVFASSYVPNAGEPKGFGEINAEITCGSQTVKPGDYIVGDDNGVVVIPKENAYEIARRAKEVEKTEKRLFEELKRGATLSEVMQLKKWEKR
ncbi:MAG: Bifunctional enzyme Fae/Hps [Methanomethylovorans sp. PtaU1.Bin093]|uniref:3-hexulose-6-phosphate synthase n=1 Tax=Methanomethylovorans sp. PtaU1.Bin093 TaxID=1811679 RepID=UPI0009D32856|nr:3-hexulose-6-phosphate synthase [Methanomethylovorans sp. PtaU1.Bin093]OPY18661.1 MAG: Bifunctional enzyme Fae/Hps [Methanomethylovorans sp. PtaU1.Bin093]